MVWWADAESLEHSSRLERIVGRIGISNCGRLRRVRHRLGDTGLYLFSVYALRHYWLTTDIRSCTADWSDGAFMDHGQAWSDLLCCGRYCARAVRDLWSRRKRSRGAQCRFQLGRELRLAQAARRLFQRRVCTQAADRAARSNRANVGRLA